MDQFSRLFVFALLLLLPLAANAELPPQVEADFAVLRGTIILQVGDEYLIDLDASDNLQEGDVLTLIAAGKKIIHPETGQVMGSLETPSGFLQVTRIHTGYSYAKPLNEGQPTKVGAAVRRFEQVPARFDDRQGNGETLHQQLQLNLPQLVWLPADSTEMPLLTFTLQNEVLAVKNNQGSLLHRYTVTQDQQLVAPSTPARRSYVAVPVQKKPKLLDQVMDTVTSPFSQNDNSGYLPGDGDPALIRQGGGQQQGVWMSPNIEGNPVGIAVADLDGDGLQETALATDNRLLITQIKDGEYTEKTEVNIPVRLRLLSLDAIDLDHNGLPELYLTAIDGVLLQSFVVEYTGHDYEIVIDKVGWFLRVAELPGEPKVLIGQLMDHDVNSFFKQPFRIERQGKSLFAGDKIKLPGLANMYSFVPFSDNEGRWYYVYLTSQDFLKVATPDGVELWESADYFGGTETWFMNKEETTMTQVDWTYIRSRLVKTPQNEILVGQNDGSRTFERYRKFLKSRLVSLSWSGFAMEENWRTAGQSGYLGDFVLGDADNDGKDEMVMAVKFRHKGLLNKPRSAIVTYELD